MLLLKYTCNSIGVGGGLFWGLDLAGVAGRRCRYILLLGVAWEGWEAGRLGVGVIVHSTLMSISKVVS